MKSKWEENPSDYFFEAFVLNVIGELPADRQDEMRSYFKTSGDDWHQGVKAAIHLSQTIEVAILDLWYRNRDIAKANNETYSPEAFAEDFIEHYFVDDSKVDVWEGDALEGAKRRIAAHQAANK